MAAAPPPVPAAAYRSAMEERSRENVGRMRRRSVSPRSLRKVRNSHLTLKALKRMIVLWTGRPEQWGIA
jgi:hypothetical protein